jgi:carbon-monoxide dehydrogenase medium subunit
MYPASFDYYRATSIKDAQHLLQQHPGAKLLAGGHSLIPLLKLRLASPAALIDIGRITELKGIGVKGGGVIHVGALTTHAEIAASKLLRAECPMLPEAASQIGDQQVRNCGTIGGNVAHADPASDLPTVLSALEARLISIGPAGERTIAAADFFQGMMDTALGEHDILTAVELKPRQPGDGMAYEKFIHPASRYAVVGAAAVVSVKGGVCTGARVSVGGLVPVATRARAVETALAGKAPTAETIEQASRQVAEHLDGYILEDVFASADYRKAMAPVFVKRALTAAFKRAA